MCCGVRWCVVVREMILRGPVLSFVIVECQPYPQTDSVSHQNLICPGELSCSRIAGHLLHILPTWFVVKVLSGKQCRGPSNTDLRLMYFGHMEWPQYWGIVWEILYSPGKQSMPSRDYSCGDDNQINSSVILLLRRCGYQRKQ